MKDPTTSASITFEGLTPGTTYVVQTRAIGSAGPSDWSDPAVLMAVEEKCSRSKERPVTPVTLS
jgi:hypothetical protein